MHKPTITVTSPNGGETMQAGGPGHEPEFQWTYTGDPGSNVKIELLKGGVLNSTIAASVPIGSGGSGSYYWDIPVSQVAGTNYRIRITSTSNASYTDTSNGDFTIIAAPTITVTSPNGGESWQPGSTHTISGRTAGRPFLLRLIHQDRASQGRGAEQYDRVGSFDRQRRERVLQLDHTRVASARGGLPGAVDVQGFRWDFGYEQREFYH